MYKDLLENMDVASFYPSYSYEIKERVDVKMLIKMAFAAKQFGCVILPKNSVNMPEIKNVIYNRPATIVFWSDGTKTVVKCNGELYDPEKGLAMAISKKAFGNKGNYYNEFKKWLPKEEESKQTSISFDGKEFSKRVKEFAASINKGITDATKAMDELRKLDKEEKKEVRSGRYPWGNQEKRAVSCDCGRGTGLWQPGDDD